jgi:hypothetical protein
MTNQQGFDMSQFTPPPPPPPFGLPHGAQVSIMSVLIFFPSIYHYFFVNGTFYAIQFYVTMEDQVHIGTSSLQEIAAVTPSIQARTTCEQVCH